jgi:nitrate reductase gamma subunit
MHWFIGGPLVYIAVIVFLYRTIATVIKFCRMPRHFRWDLYPIPHQEPEGSKYQKVDFVNMKPHVSHLHELKEMGQEMLYIKRALVNNPKVWSGSFPLHAGLYLGTLWLVMLCVGGIFELNGIQIAAQASSGLAVMIYYITEIAGILSFILGLGGCLVLLWLRLVDEAMRDMSDYLSYFNLGLLLFMFATGLIAWGWSDPSFQTIRFHAGSLLILNPSNVDMPLVTLEMFAFSIFLLYLPFSRMMHFVGKYFFYNNIMWDDTMLKDSGVMDQDIAAYLQFKVTWSAKHIHQNGTWVDQVVEGPPKEGNSR